MKIFSLLAVAVALLLTACDRHQWDGEDGVKELYEHHEEGHGDKTHGGDNGKAHGGGDDHKKKEAH